MNAGLPDTASTAAYTHASKSTEPSPRAAALESKAWQTGFLKTDTREQRPRQANDAADASLSDALPTPPKPLPLSLKQRWQQSMLTGYTGFVHPQSSQQHMPQPADSSAPMEDVLPGNAAQTPGNLLRMYGANFLS